MAFELFGYKILSKSEDAKRFESTEMKRPDRGWGASDFKAFELRFDNIQLSQLYDYAYYSDTYRTIMNAKTRETFRNGGEWEPDFVRKCTNELCGKKFEAEIDTCDNCGATTREPDQFQLIFADKLILKANENGQNLLELYSSIDPDFHVIDNAYICIMKSYTYDSEGKIASGRIKEFVRADPLFMRKIISKQGIAGIDYYENKPFMVCPEHRDRRQMGEKCGDCGRKLYPAHFVVMNTANANTYYLAGEVIHKTMYTPTIFYGFPMALTVMWKIRTLLAMDQYMYQYYGGQKSPKGLAIIGTPNVDSAITQWDQYVEKVKNYPHMIFPLFVPSLSRDAQVSTSYIDFSRSLTDMQYVEARTEMINRVGAIFGVSPVFQADLSAAGGLNNEGLQITVTTRAIMHSQITYNDISDKLFRQLGVTDWHYKLKLPEEKDEMAELQLEAQKIANAQTMDSMGFEVELKPDGDFKYSNEKKEKPAPPVFPPQAPPQQTQAEAKRDEGEPPNPSEEVTANANENTA